MRRMLRQAIPSMFHRRLALLGVVGAGLLALMMGQTVRLTTGEGHHRRVMEAERPLQVHALIPTVRGRILDRNGRVLAFDDSGWEVAVQYRVITGEWARSNAVTLAQRKARATWGEMSAADRAAAADAEQALFDEQVEMLWRMLAELGEVDRLELDRRRDSIRSGVQTMASHLDRIRWERKRAELGVDIPYSAVVQPIAEQRQAHTILPRVSEENRVLIQGFIADAERANQLVDPRSTKVNPMGVWTQVELRRPKQRLYPFETVTIELDRSTMPSPLRRDEPLEIAVEGVATHILGGIRNVWREDFEGPDARPFRRPNGTTDLGGYRPGDQVGHGGIEGSMEMALRGLRGQTTRHIDTGQEDRIEPRPGQDIQLTLDIHLQARVQAIMTANPTPTWPGLLSRQDWHQRPPNPEVDPAGYERWQQRLGAPMFGAAVVLDAESSEVLAAVTVPTMPARVLEENPRLIYGDLINTPWVNRAVAMPYQPGSTIKPLMLLAAVTEGRHHLHHPINCQGPFDPERPTQMRCWIFRNYLTGHGPLQAPAALAESCNVYFYTLGRDMGLQRTIEWYRKFGLGRPTDVGLGVAGAGGEEIAGSVGNPRQTFPADPIFMGIGQGPVDWSVVQAAGSYATIARGGLHLSPTLVKDRHRDGVVLARRQAVDLNLDSATVLETFEGLDRAVNAPRGTGYMIGSLRERIFNVEGVKVLGKSGTAQTGPRWIADFNNNGRPDPDEIDPDPGDHAWMIAMVQPPGKTRPTHIVAVVVEYAGSGGQIAGPVVNQIIHAMQQEGYLP
jgi:penicillin-binding protein 2